VSAVLGVALFAGGALWSSQSQRRSNGKVVDAARAAVQAAAQREKQSAAQAQAALARVARATVEVRVDQKAILTVDGKTIEAGVPVEVEPGAHHVLGVQRPGHRSVRSLELPTVAGGDHVVIGLWSRGLSDSATGALPPAAPAATGVTVSMQRDHSQAPLAGEPGASTSRGPVVEAVMHDK
jgi:hypothetical protein